MRQRESHMLRQSEAPSATEKQAEKAGIVNRVAEWGGVADRVAEWGGGTHAEAASEASVLNEAHMLRQRVRQAAHSGVDCLSQVAEQSAATKAAALQLAQDKLQTMSTELGRLEIKLVCRPSTSTSP